MTAETTPCSAENKSTNILRSLKGRWCKRYTLPCHICRAEVVMPYSENGIKFIPQLFYKVFALPFGIQSTQIHLNCWKQKDFDNFEKFIIKNLNKIITYDQAIEKVNNNLFYKLINISTKKILQFIRIIKKRF